MIATDSQFETDSNRIPIIGITMGDPAGVGPEICLKLLNDQSLIGTCRLIVLGDVKVLARVGQICGLPVPTKVISAADLSEPGVLALDDDERVAVLDFATPDVCSVQAGQLSKVAGGAAYRYIEAAIQLAMAGQIDAVTTAPINKRALHMAGHHFPGHTEIFTQQSGATRSCMMQYSDEVTCSFVTTHVGYHEVPELLTHERIVEVINLSTDALTAINGRKPNFVVCGLNPHAGEDGLFGNREEERIIIPAIEAARKTGLEIEGPLPPDTCFLPAKRKATDCFICMYHDQGHIPLKALAFDSAVNCTLGLPIIRTSVDHGTAFDIAWKNIASPSSLKAAVELAIKLARTKTTAT